MAPTPRRRHGGFCGRHRKRSRAAPPGGRRDSSHFVRIVSVVLALHFFAGPRAADRLAAAHRFLDRRSASEGAGEGRGFYPDSLLVVGASDHAARDLLRERTRRAGALLGAGGRGLFSLAEELAGPELARRGLRPAPAAAWPAVVAQVVHDARRNGERGSEERDARARAGEEAAVDAGERPDGAGRPNAEGPDAEGPDAEGPDAERPHAGTPDRLGRFAPISEGPGLARRLAATFEELRAAGVAPEKVAAGDGALGWLFTESLAGLERAGFADRAGVFEAARLRVESGAAPTPGTLLVLDAPLRQPVVRDFLAALAERAAETLFTFPEADRRSRQAARALGAAPCPAAEATPDDSSSPECAPEAPERVAGGERCADGKNAALLFGPADREGAGEPAAERSLPAKDDPPKTDFAETDLAEANDPVAALQRRLFRPEADAAAPDRDGSATDGPADRPRTSEPATDDTPTDDPPRNRAPTSDLPTSEPGRQSPGGAERGLTVFRAPGAAAEALEIARAFLREAGRGVPFDRMAVLLAAPGEYAPALREAFDRARIPAFFDTGTAPPARAARAFLALLDCALADLSADAFFEYRTLDEHRAAPDIHAGSEPDRRDDENDDRDDNRDDDPDEDREKDPGDPFAALRRQEEWVREARVIGGLERWKRRLALLAERFAGEHEAQRKAASDDPAKQAEADEAARRQRALARFTADSLPLLEQLAALPRDHGRKDAGAAGNDAPTPARNDGRNDDGNDAPDDTSNDDAPGPEPTVPPTGRGRRWGEWAEILGDLARSALRRPEPVLDCLAETAPMAGVGPLPLAEVRRHLGERLLGAERASSGDRYGRVFVAPIERTRGLAFRAVAIPGLHEGGIGGGLREDPLLPDRRRPELAAGLPLAADRLEAERLRLALAVGAATERLFLSCSSLKVVEGRPLTPSYFLVEALRAGEGRTFTLDEIETRAGQDSGVVPGLRAAKEPEAALDRSEFDLSLLSRALAPGADPEAARGAGAYLLRDERLATALRREWMRNRRAWQPADGFLAVDAEAKAALGGRRPTARTYSATGLETFAKCPYQFYLKNIARLRAVERPERLVHLDPLTRGSLVHEVFFLLGQTLRERGLTPLPRERLAEAVAALPPIVDAVAKQFREEHAPEIERIWNDELDGLLGDLRGFLEREAGNGFRIVANELTFGMVPVGPAAPESRLEPAVLPGGLRLRGSIDAVEEKANGERRVTDYKTGKDSVRVSADRRVLFGGEALQPLLYAFAQEALTGRPTASGRLYYTTLRGAYHQTVVETDTAEARSLLEEFVRRLDEAVSAGHFPADPNPASRWSPCRYCDYLPICGPGPATYRETKNPRGAALDEVQALRELP